MPTAGLSLELTEAPGEEEGVRVRQPQTAAFADQTQLGADGTLFVCDSRVCWLGVDGRGFSLQYPQIAMHAISRDLSNFPHECLYVMVNRKAAEKKRRHRPEIIFADVTAELANGCSLTAQPDAAADDAEAAVANGDSDAADDADDDDGALTEMRFVPADKGVLDTLFEQMSQCQTLHPADDDEFSDDDDEVEGADELQGDGGGGDGDFFTSADGLDELNDEGRAVLQRILRTAGDAPSDQNEEEQPDTMETD